MRRARRRRPPTAAPPDSQARAGKGRGSRGVKERGQGSRRRAGSGEAWLWRRCCPNYPTHPATSRPGSSTRLQLLYGHKGDAQGAALRDQSTVERPVGGLGVAHCHLRAAGGRSGWVGGCSGAAVAAQHTAKPCCRCRCCSCSALLPARCLHAPGSQSGAGGGRRPAAQADRAAAALAAGEAPDMESFAHPAATAMSQVARSTARWPAPQPRPHQAVAAVVAGAREHEHARVRGCGVLGAGGGGHRQPCQLHQLVHAEAQWPHQLLIQRLRLRLLAAGAAVQGAVEGRERDGRRESAGAAAAERGTGSAGGRACC